MRVELYTKQSCLLCEDATEWLQRARASLPFELVEHDIYERAEWFTRYRYDIPVVIIDGIERFKLRFTQAELETALRE